MKNLKTLLIVGLGLSFLNVASANKNNKANFIGVSKCTECHADEAKAWQNTHHFKTFKELHRRKEAKDISKAMGIKRIKKDKTCAQCHYTFVAGDKKPSAGISCESCHGGAKNWIDVHNDYGGKTAKKETETAANKEKRIKNAIAGGMIRPENIYHVARNCFGCHTVPNEKLVNVGGHKAGSPFELVSWSQGEVRHNFLSGDGKNRPASKERKRVLYVAGKVLDLEFGLRGAAEATADGKFLKAMSDRVSAALGDLKKINGSLNSGELTKIIAAGSGAKLTAGNSAGLNKAADEISGVGEKWLNGNDGSKMAAVDGMVPTTAKGKATN